MANCGFNEFNNTSEHTGVYIDGLPSEKPGLKSRWRPKWAPLD